MDVGNYNDHIWTKEERHIAACDEAARSLEARHRNGWDDGPGYNLMPHEVAGRKLDRLKAEESFYASSLLNVACNGWYIGKQEEMQHLEKCLNDCRGKRIEQEKIYVPLLKKHEGVMRELRQYEIDHAEEQALRLAAWVAKNPIPNEEN